MLTKTILLTTLMLGATTTMARSTGGGNGGLIEEMRAAAKLDSYPLKKRGAGQLYKARWPRVKRETFNSNNQIIMGERYRRP